MVARVTRMTKRRLGELLRAEGMVTEEQVQQALVEQRKSNMFLGEALVKLGYVTEESIASTIAQQFNLPYIASEQYDVQKDVLDIFPESLLWEYQFLPLEKLGPVLIIVGAGLMNHDVLAELERLSGQKICQFVGTWNDIRRAIDEQFKNRKKREDSDLTSLGKMLLVEDPAAAPVDEEEVAVDAGDLGADLAEAVGTSQGLQEALAAVEGMSDDDLGGTEDAASDDEPAPPALAGSGKGASSNALPKTSERSPSSSKFSDKKISAFSGSFKSVKEKEGEGEGEGEAKDEKDAGGKKPAKGGLLGFLKK